MNTATQTTILTEPNTQITTMQEQIDVLQLQLAVWAEAAARDRAEHSVYTRKLIWQLLEAHKLTERADMLADARYAQRQAEERATEALRECNQAEAELHDLKLLLGATAHGPLARRLAVAREVWALAWNTREVLSIGGRIGFDAAAAQLDILLENKDWDGRPDRYSATDDTPIPATELARPSAVLTGSLLGHIVHTTRRHAAKTSLWAAAAIDAPWDDLPQDERSLCEWIGQVLAIAGAGGSLQRTYALTGALDDVAWLLREQSDSTGVALALARIDTCLAGDDADRAGGTTRRALQAVAAAAADLRAAIADHSDDEVVWMRAPSLRIETLDRALDAYDLATANGADLLAGEDLERAINLALWSIAGGERELGNALLSILIGAPIGDTLARGVATQLRERNCAHINQVAGA